MAVHGVGHCTCPTGPFMTPELCNDDFPYAIFLLIALKIFNIVAYLLESI